ncbi:MAG TPA: hypothetical protein DDW51_05710 [Cyanobacteria bacterium UBA11367]|nr:hypothetical protein [Cyanobacteria bacterium UBA11367]HBE56779.1 hypothetical protein [Cyanobacteria bacterium UBA11366]HBK83947.1 hypothetical protein [Flavobacterium sp.]HCA95983.1 hypothetical protein [Cyanobacteria bacterium UBA9226]
MAQTTQLILVKIDIFKGHWEVPSDKLKEFENTVLNIPLNIEHNCFIWDDFLILKQIPGVEYISAGEEWQATQQMLYNIPPFGLKTNSREQILIKIKHLDPRWKKS